MQNTFSGNTKLQFKRNAKYISIEMEMKSKGNTKYI